MIGSVVMIHVFGELRAHLFLSIIFLIFIAGCGNPSEMSRNVEFDADSEENVSLRNNDVTDEPGNSEEYTQPDTGPGKVLSYEEALTTANLGLQIKINDSGFVDVPSLGEGVKVYRIGYSFRSQRVWGSDWSHDVTMFVPLVAHPQLSDGAFVVLQHGTENAVDEISDAAVFRTHYAAQLTALLGVPSVVVPNLPGAVNLNQAPSEWRDNAHASCFGQSLAPRRYVPCLLQILSGTGDLDADPFRPLAFSWMRAITAAIEVSQRAGETQWQNDGPIDFHLRRAVILADGKRAVGARMAAALDPRIDGVFGAADFGDVKQLVKTIHDQWHSELGWFEHVETLYDWLNTDAGKSWLETVDPALWEELVRHKIFVNAIGTNDELFPIQVSSAYESSPNHNLLVVANYGNGIGTQAHLENWYAFVAHTYLGRPWQKVSVELTKDRGNVVVTAESSGESEVLGVILHSVQQHRTRDDMDFRDAIWTASEMSIEEGRWRGLFAPVINHSAAYVEVIDSFEVDTILDEPVRIGLMGRWSSPVLVVD